MSEIKIKGKKIEISFPFVEIKPSERAPFCVDGRAGNVAGEKYGPYPQMLGGSLMPVVLEWLINQPDKDFEEVLSQVFGRLQEHGYPLGVHTSTHSHDNKSDCGFADNLGKILGTLREKELEIRKVIFGAGVNFENEVWGKIMDNLNKINLQNIPSGDKLIKLSEEKGALKQVLEGEHQELAAIVNLVSGKTLDVDNNQQHQAFNLDLWLVKEIGKAFGWDERLTEALSLGLYVATEMVLVEEKGKPRLPILINK